jgi:hypothetical protein
MTTKEKLVRILEVCLLLQDEVPDHELLLVYGFSLGEIKKAKEILNNIDIAAK